MANPILEITDGVTTVSLQENVSGLKLSSWVPGVTAPKNDGLWYDVALVDGRKLEAYALGNVVEELDLKVHGASMDTVIEHTRRLRKLLEQARYYWTRPGYNRPVYLAARGSEETNTRYALIHDWATPADGDPFAQPFFSCPSVLDDFLLTIERSHWLAHPPGESACVQATNVGSDTVEQVTISASPAAGADDCTVVPGSSSIDTSDVSLTAGNVSGAATHAAIRFTAVDIPIGATITSAFIRVQPFTLGGDTVSLRFYGEASTNPATYSTYADFAARSLTTAFEDWNPVPRWVAAEEYDLIDITAIIQEIVDTAGWAAGNALAIQIRDNGSTANQYRYAASYDAAAILYTNIPALFVTYTLDAGGQEATCDTVYVANKHTRADLTAVYYYDASSGAFSASNLLTETPPYDLLPAVPAANDYLCFCANALFDNVVIDLGTAQTGITATAWEYISGAGPTWTALTASGNTLLDETGIAAVGWDQFLSTPWIAATLNGVYGYWIRCRVTAASGATAPQQANRRIYTCRRPYTEVAAAQAAGDLDLPIKVLMSGDASSGGSVSRVVMGTRRVARGEDFSAYINLCANSHAQNAPYISIESSLGAEVTDAIAPTGYAWQFSPGSTSALAEILRIKIYGETSQGYAGAFHAFLRLIRSDASAGSGEIGIRLGVSDGYYNATRNGDEVILTPGVRDVTVAGSLTVYDLGIIQIGDPNATSMSGLTQLVVSISNSSAADQVNLVDLILIPIDEWGADIVLSASLSNYLAEDYRLEVSGVDDLRRVVYPTLRSDLSAADYTLTDAVVEVPIAITNGRPILTANEDQRLWMLGMLDSDGTGTLYTSDATTRNTVQLYGNPAYFSMRGDG